MRIWSLHPKYLDSKGIVALWREALLAKNVLQGNTVGYKNHPQLIRFKNSSNPILAIDYYLSEVLRESKNRNYSFNEGKVGEIGVKTEKIFVSERQVEYEFRHLLGKLQKRDIAQFEKIVYIDNIDVHPLFKIVEGDIETWEKL